MVVNYSKGKIYKIINNITDDIYIGSTVNSLSQRLSLHRQKKNLIDYFTNLLLIVKDGIISK